MRPQSALDRRQDVDERLHRQDTRPAFVPGTVWGTASKQNCQVMVGAVLALNSGRLSGRRPPRSGERLRVAPDAAAPTTPLVHPKLDASFALPGRRPARPQRHLCAGSRRQRHVGWGFGWPRGWTGSSASALARWVSARVTLRAPDGGAWMHARTDHHDRADRRGVAEQGGLPALTPGKDAVVCERGRSGVVPLSPKPTGQRGRQPVRPQTAVSSAVRAGRFPDVGECGAPYLQSFYWYFRSL